MFNLIKSGVKSMAKIKKDPYARKVVGLAVAGFCIGFGGGLIVSSYE